jgi:hypothetical protein
MICVRSDCGNAITSTSGVNFVPDNVVRVIAGVGTGRIPVQWERSPSRDVA